MHVRGTDSLGTSDYSEITTFFNTMLEDASIKVFLCTDDEKIDIMFDNKENVVKYPNKVYVEKRDTNLGWLDAPGLWNVNRTREQVVGGWIDLITLASMHKVNGFITSRTSTYYHLAQLLHSNKKELFNFTKIL